MKDELEQTYNIDPFWSETLQVENISIYICNLNSFSEITVDYKIYCNLTNFANYLVTINLIALISHN